MVNWTHVEIIPGIKEALDKLNEKYICCVASNAGDSNVELMGKALERVDIRKYFNEGDFVIRCKIAPGFKSKYDLGSIVIFENVDKWIKFTFENADTGYPDIVSVVTNGVSAQSPIGDGCIVRFESIEIMDNKYTDIRKPN